MKKSPYSQITQRSLTMTQAEGKNILIPVDQFNKGMLEISIAKDFFSFLSEDMERDDSIFRGLDTERQQGLLCNISCILDFAQDSLLTKPV
jgi:hypothetical protein